MRILIVFTLSLIVSCVPSGGGEGNKRSTGAVAVSTPTSGIVDSSNFQLQDNAGTNRQLTDETLSVSGRCSSGFMVHSGVIGQGIQSLKSCNTSGSFVFNHDVSSLGNDNFEYFVASGSNSSRISFIKVVSGRIGISNPQNNNLWSQTEVQVRGACDSSMGNVEIKQDDESRIMRNDIRCINGVFQHTYTPFSNVPRVISLRAWQQNLNTRREDRIEFDYRPEYYDLTITSPTNNFSGLEENINIRGTCTQEDVSVIATVDGTSTLNGVSCSGGQFDIALDVTDLSIGNQTVTVYHYDRAVRGGAERNFTYNKRRPLRLISPFNNAVVASEAFIVGKCFDNTQNVNINIGGISRNFSCTSNQFNGLMNISSLATGFQSVFISHAGQTVNSSIEKISSSNSIRITSSREIIFENGETNLNVTGTCSSSNANIQFSVKEYISGALVAVGSAGRCSSTGAFSHSFPLAGAPVRDFLVFTVQMADTTDSIRFKIVPERFLINILTPINNSEFTLSGPIEFNGICSEPSNGSIGFSVLRNRTDNPVTQSLFSTTLNCNVNRRWDYSQSFDVLGLDYGLDYYVRVQFNGSVAINKFKFLRFGTIGSSQLPWGYGGLITDMIQIPSSSPNHKTVYSTLSKGLTFLDNDIPVSDLIFVGGISKFAKAGDFIYAAGMNEVHKVNISTFSSPVITNQKQSISLADDELIKKMYVNGDFVHIITNKQFIKIRKSNMSRTQVVNFGNSVLLDGDGENFLHYEGNTTSGFTIRLSKLVNGTMTDTGSLSYAAGSKVPDGTIANGYVVISDASNAFARSHEIENFSNVSTSSCNTDLTDMPVLIQSKGDRIAVASSQSKVGVNHAINLCLLNSNGEFTEIVNFVPRFSGDSTTHINFSDEKVTFLNDLYSENTSFWLLTPLTPGSVGIDDVLDEDSFVGGVIYKTNTGAKRAIISYEKDAERSPSLRGRYLDMNDPRQPISVGAMFSDATTNLGIDLTTGRNYELDTLFYSMVQKNFLVEVLRFQNLTGTYLKYRDINAFSFPTLPEDATFTAVDHFEKIDDDFSIIKRGDNLSFAEFSTNGTNARTIFAPTIDSNLTGFSGAIDTEFENDKVYIAKSGSIDNLKIYTVDSSKQVTGSTTHTFPNLALITSSGDYFDGTVYSQNKFKVQGNYIYGLVPGDNGRLSLRSLQVNNGQIRNLHFLGGHPEVNDHSTMYKDDDYIYIADGKTVYTFDVKSNQTSPLLVSQFLFSASESTKVFNMERLDNFLYLYTANGLLVIDYANPQSPRRGN